MLTMLAALSESSMVMEKGLSAWNTCIREVLEMHGPARIQESGLSTRDPPAFIFTLLHFLLSFESSKNVTCELTTFSKL